MPIFRILSHFFFSTHQKHALICFSSLYMSIHLFLPSLFLRVVFRSFFVCFHHPASPVCMGNDFLAQFLAQFPAHVCAYMCKICILIAHIYFLCIFIFSQQLFCFPLYIEMTSHFNADSILFRHSFQTWHTSCYIDG